MRGADFWQSRCGHEITRVFQEHYSEILVAVVQRAFEMRSVDPAMAEHLRKLADDLNPEKNSGCDNP